MIRHDCCVQDCVLFYDCESPELTDYKHSHRVVCPYCGSDRYLPDGNPAKTVYYLPFGNYVRDLYKRADVVPHLNSKIPPSEFPSGDVRRSRGWHAKVTTNPKMNGDSRNLAFIGTCDGIPLHRAKNSRSGWPFVIRQAGLPNGLWNDVTFVHMVGFYPSEYKTWSETHNSAIVHKR